MESDKKQKRIEFPQFKNDLLKDWVGVATFIFMSMLGMGLYVAVTVKASLPERIDLLFKISFVATALFFMAITLVFVLMAARDGLKSFPKNVKTSFLKENKLLFNVSSPIWLCAVLIPIIILGIEWLYNYENNYMSQMAGLLLAILFIFVFIGITSGMRTIKKAPGSLLNRIAEFLPRKQRRIINQEVEDMRNQCNDAFDKKNYLQVLVIRFAYGFGLGWSVVRWIADKGRTIVSLSKDNKL